MSASAMKMGQHAPASHIEAEAEIGHHLLRKADRLLGWVIDIPCAVLVLAEVALILVSVIARSVFNTPLVWSDEIIGLMFLWLTMFGAANALRRQDHMRMTTLVSRLPPLWRARLNAIGVAAPALMLALLIGPACQYAANQWYVQTPALGLPDSFRAGAMPVGAGLMLLVCLLRLARYGWRELVVAAAVLVCGALLFAAAAPLLGDIGNWNLLVFFVGLLAFCVLAGVPIAFCFGLCTVAYLLTTGGAPLAVVPGSMDQGMSAMILLAVPLFILLGHLLVTTRMAHVIVEFLAAALGHVRGGLNYVLLGAVLLVSGISGAKTADLAAVAPVLVPEMKRRGIDEGEIVSLLATSGAMAETIPPSIVLIIIGSVTGVSISALFAGGLLPGVVLALALALVARLRTKPQANAPARPPARAVWRKFAIAIPALALPFVIRFAVVDGIATATEVSTIGIAYAVLVGLLIYRHFEWHRLFPMLVQTASLAGAIMFIIGAATAMGWALTQSNFSMAVAHFMQSVPGGRYGFLLVSIIVMVVLGSVLEGIPAMVLFGPLLFPVAKSLGISEVHYAMVVVLSMGLGLFAPPFGLGYYAACSIARISPDAGLKRIWPYVGALFVGLLLIAAVPWITLALVR